MVDPRVMAAVAAAINAYIEREALASGRDRRVSRWVREGRLRAARARAAWSGRRRWRW